MVSAQELHIRGVYRGTNVYIVNPFTKSDNQFSIQAIRINDVDYLEDINSSAFEIDLKKMGLKPGDELSIHIKYKDSIAPSIMNMDAIKAVCSFKIENAFVDQQNYLNWQSFNETGSFPYFIEQYRWGKWITIGQVKGVGTSGHNSYKIKVKTHSGKNLYRIYQTDNESTKRYSDTILYKSQIKSVSIVRRNVESELKFSSPTQFEIFDLFGNIIVDGYGKEVRLDNLKPGKYYVNYDNAMSEFTKK